MVNIGSICGSILGTMSVHMSEQCWSPIPELSTTMPETVFRHFSDNSDLFEGPFLKPKNVQEGSFSLSLVLQGPTSIPRFVSNNKLLAVLAHQWPQVSNINPQLTYFC